MSRFSEVENCIKYLCKKNRLDTLTKFMDIVIENDPSCTITNMFFQRINEDQKNYFFENRINYFQKMIDKAKTEHNFDLSIRSLSMYLTEENKNKILESKTIELAQIE